MKFSLSNQKESSQNTVQIHAAALVRGGRDVVHALAHQRNDIVVQPVHVKFLEIRRKRNPRKIFFRVIHNLRHLFLTHIMRELLRELFFDFLVGRLNDEFRRKHVRQLGAVPVAATHHLLLLVVVIVGSEEMAEHHFRHVALMLLVDLDGQTGAVVVDLNELAFRTYASCGSGWADRRGCCRPERISIISISKTDY